LQRKEWGGGWRRRLRHVRGRGSHERAIKKQVQKQTLKTKKGKKKADTKCRFSGNGRGEMSSGLASKKLGGLEG